MKITRVVGYDDGRDVAVIVDGQPFNPYRSDGENEISFRQILELYHNFKNNEEFQRIEKEFVKKKLKEQKLYRLVFHYTELNDDSCLRNKWETFTYEKKHLDTYIKCHLSENDEVKEGFVIIKELNI